MALKNFQYNRLLQQYDETQFHNRHLEERRYQEVLRIIPEIEQIDKEITATGIAYAKMALTNSQLATDELEAKNQLLIKKKEQLLVIHLVVMVKKWEVIRVMVMLHSLKSFHHAFQVLTSFQDVQV